MHIILAKFIRFFNCYLGSILGENMAPEIPDDSRPVARPLQTPSQRTREYLQKQKRPEGADDQLRRELAALTEISNKRKSCVHPMEECRPYCFPMKEYGVFLWLIGNSPSHQTLQTEVSINWNLGQRR